jgi:hypothetical protein
MELIRHILAGLAVTGSLAVIPGLSLAGGYG